ncbi:ADP-ribose pyrophosphatase [Arthrobacter silviterrae]|uniref:NUDIX hydrolase n=1 Tax=Arthrobacter silviterrae TaxID=2026658 RepID=A0ABX0DBT6_9MICC|nr:NUDIX hydrolase [Arthrobacter silviterrae]MDQ0275706.1 ADP-ribose pyrophosphatase [Arthrobacter silviterrae]NGN83196.1 NUDIX hydrolase [Arthrobacter silviterrae]
MAGGPVADSVSHRTLQSSATVYQGRIWDVVSDTFSLTPDSQPLTRDYIAHPGAVAVVVLNDEQEVLLLRQYRHPVQMDLWEIPAGLLDVEGEDFVVGAARELAEEADLVAADWHVLADFFNSPGSSSEAIRIYLARSVSWIPEAERHVRTEEESEIRFRWVDLDDAAAAVLEGRIHNPSAVVGILAAATAARDGFASLRPASAPWPAHPGQRKQ